MKIQKIGGSLAVALSLVAFGTAMADEASCLAVGDDIQYLSQELRCDPDGYWTGPAIWQYKGKGELGCIVHEKLAKLLYEERTEPPPEIKKGNNLAKGAANDVYDGKYQDAIDQLQRFIDTILYDARLNKDFDGAAAAAAQKVQEASDLQTAVGNECL